MSDNISKANDHKHLDELSNIHLDKQLTRKVYIHKDDFFDNFWHVITGTYKVITKFSYTNKGGGSQPSFIHDCWI